MPFGMGSVLVVVSESRHSVPNEPVIVLYSQQVQ